MLTGLWVTLFGLLWGAFGLAGAFVGVIIIVSGGMILAYGYDVMNRMPPRAWPRPPSARPQSRSTPYVRRGSSPWIIAASSGVRIPRSSHAFVFRGTVAGPSTAPGRRGSSM